MHYAYSSEPSKKNLIRTIGRLDASYGIIIFLLSLGIGVYLSFHYRLPPLLLSYITTSIFMLLRGIYFSLSAKLNSLITSEIMEILNGNEASILRRFILSYNEKRWGWIYTDDKLELCLFKQARFNRFDRVDIEVYVDDDYNIYMIKGGNNIFIDPFPARSIIPNLADAFICFLLSIIPLVFIFIQIFLEIALTLSIFIGIIAIADGPLSGRLKDKPIVLIHIEKAIHH